MATHRRGLRPSQWPVRDLLGATADRGRLWDARVGAALAGLLACGAAVTVVVTSGDTARPAEPAPATQPPLALPPVGSPRALPPVASPPVHKMPPAPAPPPTAGDAGRAPGAPPRVTSPRPPRSADRATGRPRSAPADAPVHASQSTLPGQITAVIEQAERDSTAVGWLLVPVQRPADAAALLELACRRCEPAAGGRHRASDDVEQRSDRHHVGGRHRAPEPEDDRPASYRFVDDRDDDGERERAVVHTDGDDERGGSDHRGGAYRHDDSRWDDDRSAGRAARQDEADGVDACDEAGRASRSDVDAGDEADRAPRSDTDDGDEADRAPRSDAGDEHASDDDSEAPDAGSDADGSADD